MKNYDILDRAPLSDLLADHAVHLPLDWNEELSLEDYLERLERHQ